MKKRTILIADDDEDYFLVINEALKGQENNYELRRVGDGEELIDYLRRRKKYADLAGSARPGLVLLDINMPKKTGIEALKEIRADAGLCTLPVIILTASDDPRDASMSYHFGANSFITKPAHFQELKNIMSRLTQYWFETVTLPDEKFGFEF